MIFPIDIHIGSIIIPTHLLTDILAFYFGYKYYAHIRKKEGDHINEKNRFTIIIAAALGALIGSRLLASLEHLESFLHPVTLLYYYSNKTIVGGIIGGILGVEISKKFLKQKTATGDLFTLPLILGIIIGRIGCFLTGTTDGTVGNPSNLPWAFDQGDGIARHPTSLYEIVFLIITFFILKRLSNRIPMKQGLIFRLFICTYLFFRFLIEFIKPVEHIFLGLSSIQTFSIVFAIYYCYEILFVYKYRPFRKVTV